MKHIFFAILVIGIYATAPKNSLGAPSCTVLGNPTDIQTYGSNYTLYYDDTKNCYGSTNIHDEYVYDGSNGNGATQKSTGWILRGCYKCRNNKKAEVTSTSTPCGNYSFYRCVDCTTGCTNCESDLTGQPYKEGYLRIQNRQCLNCICEVTSTSYSCDKGYYGYPGSSDTGCTRCPQSGNTYGTTSTYGSQSITACYIPSNTDIEDTTGTYHFTQSCYYKN